MNNNKSNYEPQIDGLRAIAVVSIMLFHFNFSYFSGGYVGVDIFFVVSGFLITRIIVSEINKGQFSLYDFYLRRIRRVFPALIFTISIVFILSIFIFHPQDLQRIGGSTVHAIVGISNIYFWQESGYFDTQANLKPLLHTWSLGVEEQFYLVWSILLVTSFKFLKKSQLFYLLVVITILSLLSSIYFLDYAYSKEQELTTSHDTVFYLLPFRIFEFGIGGILAFYKIQDKSNSKWFLNEFLTFIGLLLIFYPVVTYNKSTIFPSYNALAPCIGTGILIFSSKHSILGKILNNPLSINIGLISYSIYLVHWPVYVFYSYLSSENISIGYQLILIVVTLVLSMISYKFVETRFRRPSIAITNEKELLKLSFLSLFIMTISAHAWANNGWSKSTISSTERLTKDEWENYTVDDQFIISTNAFHDYVWYKFLHLEKPFYDHNKKNIFIIGDSMAGDFTNIMIDSKLYNEKKMEVRTQPIRHNCKSLIKISEKTTFPNRIDSEKCFKQYSNIANSINLKNADIIVLASVWEKWTIDSLKETINYLRNNYDASLVILGNKKISEEGLTAYKKKHKKVKITDDTILINDVISEFITPTTVFIRLTDYFCHDNECPLTTDEDFLFFYDNTHLTPKGIKTVGYNLSEKGKEFRNVIEGHLK